MAQIQAAIDSSVRLCHSVECRLVFISQFNCNGATL
jgi:hypothetical protein